VAGADEGAGTESLKHWATSPVAAVVAAAVTVLIVVIVATSGGEDEKPAAPPPPAPNPPAQVSAAELVSLSESLGQPVYWAGPQGAKEYELTREGESKIAVRYPAGADSAAGALTVATYHLDQPVEAVRRAGQAKAAKLHGLPRGGLAVSDSASPTNVYFAYPAEPYQVEVFDPKPGRALELVLDRKIRPVR
jgi:hypothetical protein